MSMGDSQGIAFEAQHVDGLLGNDTSYDTSASGGKGRSRAHGRARGPRLRQLQQRQQEIIDLQVKNRQERKELESARDQLRNENSRMKRLYEQSQRELEEQKKKANAGFWDRGEVHCAVGELQAEESGAGSPGRGGRGERPGDAALSVQLSSMGGGGSGSGGERGRSKGDGLPVSKYHEDEDI